jgi:hypothetical protein
VISDEQRKLGVKRQKSEWSPQMTQIAQKGRATEAQRHGEEEEVGRQKKGGNWEKVIGIRERPPSHRTAL